jgi:hypothetical protein
MATSINGGIMKGLTLKLLALLTLTLSSTLAQAIELDESPVKVFYFPMMMGFQEECTRTLPCLSVYDSMDNIYDYAVKMKPVYKCEPFEMCSITGETKATRYEGAFSRLFTYNGIRLLGVITYSYFVETNYGILTVELFELNKGKLLASADVAGSFEQIQYVPWLILSSHTTLMDNQDKVLTPKIGFGGRQKNASTLKFSLKNPSTDPALLENVKLNIILGDLL